MRDMQNIIYIYIYITADKSRNDSVIIKLCVRQGWYTEPRYHNTRIFMSSSTWNYLISVNI